MTGVGKQALLMAFLAREYKVLAWFVLVVTGALLASAFASGRSPLVALSFVVGAVTSALAGYFGMRIAT